MNSKPLIAKSKKKWDIHEPPTVAEHGRDVREAAESIWDVIEADLVTGLKVPLDATRRLRPLLSAAGLLHDLAKVNSAFQAILLPDRPKDLRQPVRHEIFGAMVLADPDFLGGWLMDVLPNPEDRWAFILSNLLMCPNCNYEIEVSAVLAAQLREQLRKEYEADARRKDIEFGNFQTERVSLSNWFYPGIAGRYDCEQSWEGNAERAVLLMLAPIACLYERLQGEGNNWLIVIPDIQHRSIMDQHRFRSAPAACGPSFAAPE